MEARRIKTGEKRSIYVLARVGKLSEFHELLATLPEADQHKIANRVRYLAEAVFPITNPDIFKRLNPSIYELKIRTSNHFVRVFCFLHGGDVIITHPYLKKSNKTPASEIKRAETLRTRFLST